MRIATGLSILAFGAVLATGAALGQDDPIAARQALMKANGAASKVAFDMVRGTTPFDAAKAMEAMKTIAADMEEFPTLFPEGSDQGDTKASPAIWQNMDDFKALAAKLGADANAAAEAASGGLDAFKTAFGAVGQDCGACHQKYRM
jgi:cytochrome c556